jgi:UDP-N-acetylglucosamine 2-epimerase (non-hydrolysing)
VTQQSVIQDGDVVHVTGARPNFPKAAPVISALARLGVAQKLIHTGQHYDDALSDSFFRLLNLPTPDLNLGVGSGSHASQTAAIMVGIESALGDKRPAMIVVYGDVNSTIAAALVAAKLGIPVAHVEAGLRSFDFTMPEEINRRLTDQLSDLLLITSPEAKDNLEREGLAEREIVFVGNSMIDTLLKHLHEFNEERIITELNLSGEYAVATLHRPGNVDELKIATDIVTALGEVSNQTQIVLPLHPRGRDSLTKAGLSKYPNIKVIEPLNYVDFISLVKGAKFVITDSGGVQEETTILKVPCLTLRPNTERPITITHGTNQLVTVANLVERIANLPTVTDLVPPLWDGSAGERIASAIIKYLEKHE